MYTVYWEYIEKIRRFVRQKGESLVAEGSQPNAVINIMKKYGAVRASDYSGLLGNAKVHNHRELHKEITGYLNYVQENELWFEDDVLANIKLILNRHLGAPPETIIVNGRDISPNEFMENVLQLPLDDYVSVMSFKKIPFWRQDSYDVPDNWWHSKDYYNVPLDNFYAAIAHAIQNRYSLVIMGDVSEPGKYGWRDIGIIPTFDIPSEYINQDSREFRFYNKTSTDDHGMHVIGYKKYKGEDWFLFKDSASSAWKGEFHGYHFFHKDYIKLKMLAFMAHRDAIADLLEKMSEHQDE
jgi:bleomycin hydrolase